VPRTKSEEARAENYDQAYVFCTRHYPCLTHYNQDQALRKLPASFTCAKAEERIFHNIAGLHMLSAINGKMYSPSLVVAAYVEQKPKLPHW
jgi:hypothetical protein